MGVRWPQILLQSQGESGDYEDYYTLTTGLQAVEPEDCLSLEFTNPSGSGMVAYILTISIGSNGSIAIDIIRNFSIPAPGVIITPHNLNTAFNDNTAKIIKSNNYF